MDSELDALMPHRPPMRWIDALTECTETQVVATACFGAGHFAVADGLVLESALVECVAQAVAAAQGERARRSGAPGGKASGMLAAVSSFRIESRPSAGQTLRIEVCELKRFGPLSLVAGTITCDGQPVAAGELTLYA